MRKIFFISMALSILMISISGQTTFDPRRSELTSLRSQKMEQISRSLSGMPDPLWYVGMQYFRTYIKARGTPYFYDNSNVNGKICFNGSTYDDQIFMYDLVMDEMVLKAFIKSKGVDWIVLNSGWVDWIIFELYDSEHRFITESNPLLEEHKLEKGYYELIHEGPGLLMLGKHSKKLEFRADQIVYNEFSYLRDLIIIKDNEIYKVSKFRKLLRLFPENKRVLRSMNRVNKDKYTEASSLQLKEMMAYCESIIAKGLTASNE